MDSVTEVDPLKGAPIRAVSPATLRPERRMSIVHEKLPETRLTVKSTCSAAIPWVASCGLYGSRAAVTESTWTGRAPAVSGESTPPLVDGRVVPPGHVVATTRLVASTGERDRAATAANSNAQSSCKSVVALPATTETPWPAQSKALATIVGRAPLLVRKLTVNGTSVSWRSDEDDFNPKSSRAARSVDAF